MPISAYGLGIVLGFQVQIKIRSVKLYTTGSSTLVRNKKAVLPQGNRAMPQLLLSV